MTSNAEPDGPGRELRFCPRCAGALERRPAGDARALHPVCAECGFVLWQNPKPAVEALILRGDPPDVEVLLGRQVAAPYSGLWDAPGNFLNAGDTIEEALRRECRREMGIEVEVGEVVGAFDGEFRGMHVVDLFFTCRIASGEPRAADLIDAVRWFGLGALPPLASKSVARALEALRARLPSATAGGA